MAKERSLNSLEYRLIRNESDYLMALSHGNRHIADEEAADILYGIVRDICFCSWPYMELSRRNASIRTEMMSATDFANISIALYYLRNIGNDDVVSKFYLWETIMQTSVRYCEEYKKLVKEPLSDYEYKVRFAAIVPKHLYYMLPEKYKTMTDKEYDKSLEMSNEHSCISNADTPLMHISHEVEWGDETDIDVPF